MRNSRKAKESGHLAVLSALVLADGTSSSPPSTREIDYLSHLREEELREFLELADAHHVTVRALGTLSEAARKIGNRELERLVDAPLALESKRIANALRFLSLICRALEEAGCPVTVIKSLDHWPDLGGDLDLYTSGEKNEVIEVFSKQFDARLEPQSWGDRLANKWNFRIPGLPELVECHVKWLGQTGEQVRLAQRLEQRRMRRKIAEYEFPVPRPEERIVIATLQRMYRHFYIRLCDIVNVVNLVRSRTVDFVELKRTADLGAIWPGVATLVVIVSQYANRYGGPEVELPEEVLRAAKFSQQSTYVSDKFLRIPILPEAARLYTEQMVGIGASRNFRAMFRLSLLPALATAAFVGYKLTGSDKGIW